MMWFSGSKRWRKAAMEAWEQAERAEAKMGRYYQALRAADKGLHRQARKINRLRDMLIRANINPDSSGGEPRSGRVRYADQEG